MGAYQLNLCGFEKAYMQKLSIYLKKRMGEQMRIGIWDTPPDPVAPDQTACIWLGDEEGIRRLSGGTGRRKGGAEEKGSQGCFLILSPEQTDDRADRVCAYQSADIILDFLLRHAEQMQKTETNAAACIPYLEIFLDLGERRSILPCGMAYAQEKGAHQRILLIDLIPCSGLAGLLELALPQGDITDLILSLRKKKPVHLTDYVTRVGNVDVLPAACNPVVLYELSAEDMKLLFAQITGISRYDMTVILAGTPFPGIGYLFSSAGRTVCLQDEGALSACRKEELYAFYCHSGGKKERWRDLMLSQGSESIAAGTGSHLLFEWTNGPLAAQMRQILEE